ncbi:MAG: DUF4173 domain-containing protein [Pirellulales bacterium]|nr:DUF4173 domain-containing protein [Pirellulales bacterium]
MSSVDERTKTPVRGIELAALLALVVVCDLTIYRGQGFAGYGALFVAAPILLALGIYRPRLGRDVWITGALVAVLSAKLVWCGSWLAVAAGFVLIAGLAAALAGQRPYVLTVAVFASQTVYAGCDGLNQYGRRMAALGAGRTGARWLNVALPLAALLVFGMIFVVANPNVLEVVSARIAAMLADLREWLLHFSTLEVVFWIAVAWIGMGLLRPIVRDWAVRAEVLGDEPDALSEAPLFAPLRNTLATVIVLFAVYLVFEFWTLWFHEFPEGFYYSGYAHEGAAWLTFALALATAILSLTFSGRTLRDPRLGQLRRLAWTWSAQNFLLAAAVYNRLGIYVGFNGMTRMRIVGFLGITAVVVGFALVLWKIARSQSFALLIHRHLWTVALAVYVYAILPVDPIVVNYNVGRILAGDLKPSVQITEHPITADGVVYLTPLLDCPDEKIREGVRALLSIRQEEAEQTVERSASLGWTAFQLSDRWALNHLRAGGAEWNTFPTPEARREAYDAFKAYAYRWY